MLHTGINANDSISTNLNVIINIDSSLPNINIQPVQLFPASSIFFFIIYVNVPVDNGSPLKLFLIKLKKKKDFDYVTLVCNDTEETNAHKDILSSVSPFNTTMSC